MEVNNTEELTHPFDLENPSVGVVKEESVYSTEPPFHPSEYFPEWPNQTISTSDNPSYRGLRSLFSALKMDEQHRGTVNWNPLGELIRPDDHVVLKPNFVSHLNLGERQGITDTDCLVTHGSVIRAVLDYVAKALDGRGRVTLFDCPIQSANWNKLLEITGLNEIKSYFEAEFPSIIFEVKDLRIAVAEVKSVGGKRFISARKSRDVDMENYTEVDLGKSSYLTPIMLPGVDLGVSEYPRHRMRAAHSAEVNKYLFPVEVLNADVVINLPKLKTHCKGAITCALKNFVGINGHKDYLPHFRYGSPSTGGDEFPNGNAYWKLYWRIKHLAWSRDSGRIKFILNTFAYFLKRTFPVLVGVPSSATGLGGGSWSGNDTLWRMILDINRAFFYWNTSDQCLSDNCVKKRRYFAIVDGIVAGEGDGPLSPRPRKCGFLLAGSNPVALDTVAATLMGFNFERIPKLANAYARASGPNSVVSFGPNEIRIHVDLKQTEMTLKDLKESGICEPFMPPRGFVHLLAKAVGHKQPDNIRDFFSSTKRIFSVPNTPTDVNNEMI